VEEVEGMVERGEKANEDEEDGESFGDEEEAQEDSSWVLVEEDK
jgi:hypothetical protein